MEPQSTPSWRTSSPPSVSCGRNPRFCVASPWLVASYINLNCRNPIIKPPHPPSHPIRSLGECTSITSLIFLQNMPFPINYQILVLFYNHQSAGNKSNIHNYLHISMQKQQLALILTLAATALFLLSAQDSARSSQELFNEWRSQYGSMLKLTPEEETFRFKIFEKNLQEINEHNAKEGQSYKMGVNQFTAFTQSEFELSYLQKFEARSPQPEGVLEKLELSIDWVSYGAVSPVKNQGSCTATYAFSTIGGIEGISKIFYKTETEYSVQQLVDCSQSYGNSGCNSGNMVNSYQFITAKGIQSNPAYPYTGYLGSCKASSGLFKIKGYSIPSTCTDLESALMSRPVSVAVDGNNFSRYSSGIFDNCGKSISIAVLLVGATDQYYKLKNSWGTAWGEQGYIRITRVYDSCGICEYASYPNPL